VVQINGKVKGRLVISVKATREEIEAQAIGQEKIQGLIEGKTVRKVIVILGRLVNVVVG
jgi:leucyl-tRNA synthetase